MSNKIKALKIDVIKRQVYEIEIENDLPGYYAALECETIERVPIGSSHDLIIDEEGHVRNTPVQGGFGFGRDGQVYVGHGLIVGNNGSGDWVSYAIHPETVQRALVFYELSV